MLPFEIFSLNENALFWLVHNGCFYKCLFLPNCLLGDSELSDSCDEQKAFTHTAVFFNWLFPWEKHFCFPSAELFEKHKLIDLPGHGRLVQTWQGLPLHCGKSLLLTRSPQTHGCDQMSFDLHVMYFWGLYNSHSQPGPHLMNKKRRINCCWFAATE